MKKVNVKEFAKNHKKAIAMGVAGIGLTAGGVIIFKNYKLVPRGGHMFSIPHDLKELRLDSKLVDTYACVRYENGAVEATGDILGLAKKMVTDGLIPAAEEVAQNA